MNLNLFTGVQLKVPDVHLGSDLVGYACVDRPGMGRCLVLDIVVVMFYALARLVVKLNSPRGNRPSEQKWPSV